VKTNPLIYTRNVRRTLWMLSMWTVSLICSIPKYNTVPYPGLAWLKDGFWICWSNLLDLYTTGYNSSHITDWHTVTFRLNWTRLSLDYDSLRLLVASQYRAYNISARITSRTPFPTIPGVFTSPLPRDGRISIVACTYVAGGCLPSRCLAMGLYVTKRRQ
jgi:hypothetical protein